MSSNNSNFLTALATVLCLFSQAGCKKLVNVDPPVTSTSSENVYANDETAAAVLTGIYTNMAQNNFLNGGLSSMSLFPGLSADELGIYADGMASATYTGYYTNALNNSNTGISDFWISIYPIIYVANAAIEGIETSQSLTPAIKQQLLGEAYFMRAFCYFYLVNLYGDVPLVTGINYSTNALLARTPSTQVWAQVISDLQSAQGLLSPNYLQADALTPYSTGNEQRVRPTKWAADALLARAYLYISDYKNAITMADSVIDNQSLYSLDSLSNVFLANSTEAIWQLQPVVIGQNTPDAQVFIIPSTGLNNPSFPVYLSPFLLNAFEPGDQRRTNWVDSTIVGGTTYYYPYKYKVDSIGAPVTEYEMVLRLGEQYLIRAEAEANLGDLSDAQTDLNMLRTRAWLTNTPAATQNDLLAAILHERQVELFTEWGHRWLDLKRTSNINAVMGSPGGVCAFKGGAWNTNWQWYPITLIELQHDPNLVQNQGYN